MGTQGNARTILTTRRLLRLVGLALFLGIIVLFVADNFVLIEVRLLNFQTEMRLAWALLVALGLGLAGGFLAGRFWPPTRGERR